MLEVSNDKNSNNGEEISPEEKLLKNKFLISNKRPSARDGHTGL